MIGAEKELGFLTLRSRTLVLGDPQYLPSLEIPNFASERISISARLCHDSSGAVTVATLMLRGDNVSTNNPVHNAEQLPIDSAKVVAVDKLDFEEFWAETGKDRIGVISTARDDSMLKNLQKRFKLKTVRKNAIRAELVDPVSLELERNIMEYLAAIPEYSKFPFMHFRVETNNSFDRVNSLTDVWDFIPIGNNAAPPLMFACSTGHGDGTYRVSCAYADGLPVAVTIPFIEHENG